MFDVAGYFVGATEFTKWCFIYYGVFLLWYYLLKTIFGYIWHHLGLKEVKDGGSKSNN
jgi:hypothetical protein